MTAGINFSSSDEQQFRLQCMAFPVQEFIRREFPECAKTFNQRKNGSVQCMSPIRHPNGDGHSETSMLINADNSWHDFGGAGNNRHGNVVTLCRFAKGISKGAAWDYIANMAGVTRPVSFEQYRESRKDEVLNDAMAFFHSCLKAPEHKKELAYLEKRLGGKKFAGVIDELQLGFAPAWADTLSYLAEKHYTGEQIAASGLKYMDNRIIFPYIVSGDCQYMCGRCTGESSPDSPKYKKLQRSDGYTEHPVWGIDTLYSHRNGERRASDDPIVIAEGIMDAISFYAADYPVLSAVTGQFSGEQYEDLLRLIGRRRVYIGMDYDPETRAGQEFTRELAGRLHWAGVDVRVYDLETVQFATGKKDRKLDISEMWQESPCRETLAALIDGALPYPVYHMKFAPPDKWDLEEYLRDFVKREQMCRWHGRAEVKKYQGKIKRIVEEMPVKFDDDQDRQEFTKTVEAIFSEAVKPMREAQARDVFFEQQDGFVVSNDTKTPYSWDGKTWHAHDKEWVEGKIQSIADFAGEATATLQSSATNLVMSNEDHRAARMNGNPSRIAMLNGTYDRESKRFYEGEWFQDDHTTVLWRHNFLPDAACPLWESKVLEMMGGDAQKVRLLQQWFGYHLLPNCKYQKAMGFYGKDGSNGKSLVINILQHLIGNENMANLDISSFGAQFALKDLLDKVGNSASEIEDDISKAAVKKLKQLVCGEPIDVDVKYKDHIKLEAMCKHTFSMNQPPKFKGGYTDAIARRMLWIHFTEHYVESPTGAHDHKKDTGLQKKLEAESDGIFAWMVRGADDLEKNGRFIETDDSSKMEFEVRSDSEMYDFVSWWIEEHPESTIFKEEKDVFNLEIYKAWEEWNLIMHTTEKERENMPDWEKARYKLTGAARNTFMTKLQEVVDYEKKDRRTINGKSGRMFRIKRVKL